MRGHYVTSRAIRLHHSGHRAVEVTSGRLYSCVLCRRLTIICSRCDRGQIYCSPECSQKARRRKQRKANRDYQDTKKGRRKHAERTHRYRQRKRRVARLRAQCAPVSDHYHQQKINYTLDADPPVSTQKKVTHQGSVSDRSDELMLLDLAVTGPHPTHHPRGVTGRCHMCRHWCPFSS